MIDTPPEKRPRQYAREFIDATTDEDRQRIRDEAPPEYHNLIRAHVQIWQNLKNHKGTTP